MPRIVVWLVVVAGLLGARALEVEAAYRVTFQNGTSVEVQGYDDVGDAIRYPRYGGTIIVPKAQVTAIEDVPPRLPSPAALPTPSSKPVSSALPGDANAPGLGALVTRGGHPSPDADALPSRRVTSRQEAPTSPASGQARQAGRPLLSGPSFMMFLVPVLMALVIIWFGLQKAGVLGRGDDLLPYEKKSALLSPAERSFYGVLARAVADRYPIFAKVRLGDLHAVAAGTPQPLAAPKPDRSEARRLCALHVRRRGAHPGHRA